MNSYIIIHRRVFAELFFIKSVDLLPEQNGSACIGKDKSFLLIGPAKHNRALVDKGCCGYRDPVLIPEFKPYSSSRDIASYALLQTGINPVLFAGSDRWHPGILRYTGNVRHASLCFREYRWQDPLSFCPAQPFRYKPIPVRWQNR